MNGQPKVSLPNSKTLAKRAYCTNKYTLWLVHFCQVIQYVNHHSGCDTPTTLTTTAAKLLQTGSEVQIQSLCT